MMQHIEALVESYAQALAEKGIRCKVSKRYFESVVLSRSRDTLMIDDRVEKKRYREMPNRYYGVVLRFSPLQSELVEKALCKEYVILLRRIERPHRGAAPREYRYPEEQVLRAVERRLLTILRRAESQPPARVCRDTVWDAVRYMCHTRYSYKKKILGKDRDVLEQWCFLACGILGLLLVFLLWLL